MNELRDESGRHPRRTVQLDMEKLLRMTMCTVTLAGENTRNSRTNMTRKLHVSTLTKWMKEQVHKYKTVYI